MTDSNCQVSVCDRAVSSRGHCKQHYEQIRRNGEITRCSWCDEPLAARHKGQTLGLGVWCSDECQLQLKYQAMLKDASLVDGPLEDKCIIASATNAKGYPKMYARLESEGGKQVWLGHRLAWIREFGSIPQGYDLDHRCQNPACFRVDHLQPVTRSEHGQITWQRYNWRQRLQRSLKRTGFGAIPLDVDEVAFSVNEWTVTITRQKEVDG